jgi:hypothetical protein
VTDRGIAARARAIDEDPATRAYAAAVSFVHPLTAVAWFTYKHVATLVTGEDYACWPLWPGCEDVRPHLSVSLVTSAVVLYALLGSTAAALFLLRRPRAALVAFVVAAVLGTSIYALDYRLRLNQTYMASWVVLALVFAPRPNRAIPVLVALFYFWAGTIKWNREWLTGAALYARPALVPQALVPAACVYVALLETVLVWGLFSSRPWTRWAVYAQLLVFHATSYSVVGWFYPLVMLALTSIYPLTWVLSPADALTSAALLGDRETRRIGAGVTLVFSAFQLVPWLFPGDTAVTGEGRLFTLHMFDARVECRGGAIVRGASSPARGVALINDRLETRLRCDPIVLRDTAERLCGLVASRPDAGRVNVDVAVDAKRATDPSFRPLIHVDDFCHAGIDYSLWHHNAWIAW